MTSSYTDILAKSGEPRITLKIHIDDCLLIASFLERSFPQVNHLDTIRFPFWELLRKCIIFHDLGKGHVEFQNILSGAPNNWLGQRHELFSLPFIEGFELEESQKKLMRLVIAGHHKDFDKLNLKYISKSYKKENSDEDDWEESERLDFVNEFKKNVLVKLIHELVEKEYTFKLNLPIAKHPGKLITNYLNKATTGLIKVNDADYFELLLLFGALKHCDHLGSARLTSIQNIVPDDFAFLDKQQKELQIKNGDFHQHQIAAGEIQGNLILTAPTGSGKTESAMLWLKKQMHLSGQGRVFYILPFTASINAMFERLGSTEKGLGDQEKVGMLHGKLSDYLYDYFDDFQYANNVRKEKIEELKHKFRTIYTPLKVITPFQLLKNLFGLKGFEQGLFEMVGSYFIFDEIHAYAPETFAQIKVLLEYATQYLKVKVMVMTATLPSFLKKEIETAIGSYTEIKATQELYDSFDRHQIRLQHGLLSDNLEQIQLDLQKGTKVLVVCNTVKQAQSVYTSLKPYATRSVLLHSAFNGENRTEHEKTLKQGEQDQNDPIQLLVGTQAIEVSLDIDYDVIYTEPAPIDALVQRFGRINRRRIKGICPVYVFQQSNPTDFYIYSAENIKRTIAAFETIIKEDNGIVKEQKLQRLIDEVYPDWDTKSKEKFDFVYFFLKASVSQLAPLVHSNRSEEEFYKQFDGIKVLPIGLKERFIGYLSEFNFIKAESLKVQIRKNKFAQLNNERDDNFSKEAFVIQTKKGDPITIEYWTIQKKYDPELGLLYDEQEQWNDPSVII
ncbi:CRISPR-associated helicase Cas3' [Xanthocytophaga agilis]|uniref:CRISPR-associated helicase Cas3 n=1 Tax=Xanthocytophaga agilis TaxID=3048010 RepID=A0AAE3UEF9_9BACT|nr:CRISPR-associated helicase Cas3' [Xanthocytophaga agilis]MDJ1500207.1 CRISPR-associated helicase Cas3' [Xanthocytophaga agilis]